MRYFSTISNRVVFLIMGGIAISLIFSACSEKVVDGGDNSIPEYTNLEFVAKGEPFTFHDRGGSANFPLWAPDGKTIYYMNILGNWWEEYTFQKKQIRRIDGIGSEPEVIFEDNYLFLSLSEDGTTFASTIDNSIGWSHPGGNPLVLIDIASGKVDTLPLDTTIRCSVPPRLSLSGDSLFFYGTYIDSTKGDYSTAWLWGSFFVYDLVERTYTRLFDEHPYLVAGFDLCGNGTQIITAGKIRNFDGTIIRDLENVGMWQRVSPDEEIIVGSFGSGFFRGNEVRLVRYPDDELIKALDLNDELIYAEFDFSPDGSKILMAVSFPLSHGGLFLSTPEIYMYSIDQSALKE